MEKRKVIFFSFLVFFTPWCATKYVYKFNVPQAQKGLKPLVLWVCEVRTPLFKNKEVLNLSVSTF